MNWRRSAPLLVCLALVPPGLADESTTVRIGSKAFTESVILAEIVAHLAENEGLEAEHIEGLGGTRLLWEALLAGQIDIYPEYTGTMSEEIFAGEGVHGAGALRTRLAESGLKMTDPLGFNNTYVIGMKEEFAAKLGIRTISDLRDHPDLTLRFSNEFMKRADGWGALAQRYQLPHQDVRGLEHALAYEALDKGVIQVTDLYATDAKIRKLQLRRLEDDLAHFPQYHAVFVYRAELEQRAPTLVAELRSLEAAINETAMTNMNARVELDGLSESQVAADFLTAQLEQRAAALVTEPPRAEEPDQTASTRPSAPRQYDGSGEDKTAEELLAEARRIQSHVREESVVSVITRCTLEHLNMVAVSLAAAMLVAIPLGIVAARKTGLAQPILGIVGIIQTIPAIALLVLLIRPVSYFSDELGYPQAVVALFLYSLLPIVRNTYTALRGISPQLHESAVALGLPPWVRLWRIELPLASRMILAGVKTAAVINVGFATLGGFIGAGGYGEPIFTGIRLNDYGVILQGAVPAAMLALLVQGLFELVDRIVVPKGLRLKSLE